MVKHLVLAKFKPGVTMEQIADLKKSMAALPALIPEIQGYDFGQDLRPEKTVDFALAATFNDMAAVKRYLAHPDHAGVGKYIRSLCESLQVVDFEYE